MVYVHTNWNKNSNLGLNLNLPVNLGVATLCFYIQWPFPVKQISARFAQKTLELT